ncbi:MAG TPA: hypothetical protein VML01_13125, partial [Bryobacterales bacterium]|nr:hypothetical protein [Bryobacterales bacterium]
GVVAGLIGAVAATRLLTSFLFQISATDWRTFIGAIGVLAVVALFACYRPAKLASRTDPATTLRYE